MSQEQSSTAQLKTARSVELDQFYTRADVAGRYMRQVLQRWPASGVLFVEPSAGAGAFLRPLLANKRQVRAMDIDPTTEDVECLDFLNTTEVFTGDHEAVVVVGNPPFGKNASMAVKFFNHAAQYADEIAFIVPRTFRKVSIQKRLHLNFHRTFDENVQPYAFLLNGCLHDVPCAWQIWTRHNTLRVPPQPPPVDHLISYTQPESATFAMRRVGFYAGKVSTDDIGSLSQSTHYFMNEMSAGVMDIMRHIEWTDVVAQTAGVRSLSKTEIAFKLHEAYYA